MDYNILHTDIGEFQRNLPGLERGKIVCDGSKSIKICLIRISNNDVDLQIRESG